MSKQIRFLSISKIFSLQCPLSYLSNGKNTLTQVFLCALGLYPSPKGPCFILLSQSAPGWRSLSPSPSQQKEWRSKLFSGWLPCQLRYYKSVLYSPIRILTTWFTFHFSGTTKLTLLSLSFLYRSLFFEHCCPFSLLNTVLLLPLRLHHLATGDLFPATLGTIFHFICKISCRSESSNISLVVLDIPELTLLGEYRCNGK